MFSRLNQLARHLSRPLPNYLHNSAAARTSGGLLTSRTGTMAAMENSKKMIHTAGCIIIGDEVLGGKVSHDPSTDSSSPVQYDPIPEQNAVLETKHLTKSKYM